MKKFTVFLCASVAIVFLASPAFATVIFEHLGLTNPSTEGWAPKSGPGVTVGPIPDPVTPAWYVYDNSTAKDSVYNYTGKPFPDELNDLASTYGWTLRLNLAVEQPSDPLDASIFAEYSNATTRYSILFGSKNGHPIVSLSDGNVALYPPAGHILEGYERGYHEYELIFDPSVGSAALWVNGNLELTDYKGHTSGPDWAFNRVVWGAADSDYVGRAHYNLVQFEVNPVPEPATMLLVGAGLIGLAGLGRKKFLKRV